MSERVKRNCDRHGAAAAGPHCGRGRRLGRRRASALGVLRDVLGLRPGERALVSVYPLADIAAAHRSLEQSGGFGKRVVEIS